MVLTTKCYFLKTARFTSTFKCFYRCPLNMLTQRLGLRSRHNWEGGRGCKESLLSFIFLPLFSFPHSHPSPITPATQAPMTVATTDKIRNSHLAKNLDHGSAFTHNAHNALPFDCYFIYLCFSIFESNNIFTPLAKHS